MATDISVRVGRRIHDLRIARGWTQSMLADHASLAREHLSELERGNKEIGIRALARIVEALDIELDKFFVDM